MSIFILKEYRHFFMAKRQYYGIKFPTTIDSIEKPLIDLNMTAVDDVKSQLMHLVFTPVGQRLRRPTFGTKLIQFLFNPNDMQTWNDVYTEIKETVAANIPGCKITDIDIYDVNEGRNLMVKMSFEVDINGIIFEDEILTDL